jgi:hypothetical protein
MVTHVNTQQRPGQGKATHDVMVRPNLTTHRKLELIAAMENRRSGPQALKFVEEGIDRYLAENPELAKQLQAQA